jgi:hypothetical protein
MRVFHYNVNWFTFAPAARGRSGIPAGTLQPVGLRIIYRGSGNRSIFPFVFVKWSPLFASNEKKIGPRFPLAS